MAGSLVGEVPPGKPRLQFPGEGENILRRGPGYVDNERGRGVRNDYPLPDAIAVAAPQVDYLDAVAIDRDGVADFTSGREVSAKRIGDLAVTLRDVAADQVRRYRDLEDH